MKKYNFNAGPSILPQEVIEQTANAVKDFQGEGLSILEISHRAKYFRSVMDEAEALMKELLGVPEGYRVLSVIAIGYADYTPKPLPPYEGPERIIIIE